METQQISLATILSWSENDCRAFIEELRWPGGVRCPHCDSEKPWRVTRRATSKNVAVSLFKCRRCKRQFTTTVGTILEDSKIPLQKWLVALYLMTSSSRGVNAHLLHRSLDITYKSATRMCSRIHEAIGRQIA